MKLNLTNLKIILYKEQFLIENTICNCVMLEISCPRNPPSVVSERKHCQPLAVPEISSQIGGITTALHSEKWRSNIALES